MKFRVAFLVWGAMTTGAHASSFVVLDPMTKPLGPSMIVLGSPAPESAADTPNANTAAAAPAEFKVPLAFPLPGEEAEDGDREVATALPPPAEPKPADAPAPQPDATYHVPVPQVPSPSIIAFGDVQPPVSYEQLASIGPAAEQKTHQRPEQMPVVIRGGLVGDPFARPAAAAPVKIGAKAPAGANQGPDQKDAPSRRDAPPAAPPPPEPPTRKPE